MGKMLTDRVISKSNHIFHNRPDNKIGCGLKSFGKKAFNVAKKGYKILRKAQDVIHNLDKKAIKTLGTNQTIRDVIEAVPFGDTINGVTKVASEVVRITDKMNDKIKEKKNPFDKDVKEDVKKVINDAKNDPGIKKLLNESKNMIKDLFGKVDKSDLPQKEKEEIKEKADTINLDLIKDAKSKSVAGKLAKSLPYAMFVNKTSKRPEIPKKYQTKFNIPKKSFNNEGGRLFLSGSGRLGLGLTLTSPEPNAGAISKISKPKKISKEDIKNILFN